MNIQEIQKAKQQLESDLRESIQAFEKETGVWVSDIFLGEFPDSQVSVNVRL